MNTRAAHWIRGNDQERIPPRMVAFDTESRSSRSGVTETQDWRIGCAIRWRTNLKTGDHAEARVFDDPMSLWAWIDSYCHREQRTIVWAHNLAHDVRISMAMSALPVLGYEMEWCNLDQNVSVMVWHSDHGTIVLADTWTWLPVSLGAISPGVGLVKFGMPSRNASDEIWAQYCMRDAQIVYRVASELTRFIQSEHLGNWQPTGAGMAYSTWRHKFMEHNVLVHDDTHALEAERSAMHTGRAEAWKHGKFYGEKWSEVDMRNAYLVIGSECELPRKLRMHTRKLTDRQYDSLAATSRVLALCDIRTDIPVVPYHHQGRNLWPVGAFQTWLWDTEISCAKRHGASVSVREAYIYAKGPILRSWATWVLSILRDKDSDYSPIVRTWLKHCSRALIGRMSLRSKSWELFGGNPDGIAGITHVTDVDTGETRRMMHVGGKTFIESGAEESRDSVPMVTSWIMAECRVRLWDAMVTAGLENIAHVDTDSMLVSSDGLARLRQALGASFGRYWQVKGTWATIDVQGPRHYYRGRERVISGVPLRAEELSPGVFRGERWSSISSDLESSGDGVVTTQEATWTPKRQDPRRRDAPGVQGETVAYAVGVASSSNMSDAETDATGE